MNMLNKSSMMTIIFLALNGNIWGMINAKLTGQPQTIAINNTEELNSVELIKVVFNVIQRRQAHILTVIEKIIKASDSVYDTDWITKATGKLANKNWSNQYEHNISTIIEKTQHTLDWDPTKVNAAARTDWVTNWGNANKKDYDLSLAVATEALKEALESWYQASTMSTRLTEALIFWLNIYPTTNSNSRNATLHILNNIENFAFQTEAAWEKVSDRMEKALWKKQIASNARLKSNESSLLLSKTA
jgi:hypothetical protein